MGGESYRVENTLKSLNLADFFFIYTVRYWSQYRHQQLNHIRLSSFLWDICKQCRPRPDAKERGVVQNAASDQGLHYLLTECYLKFE